MMATTNTQDSEFNFLILVNFTETSYKALDYLIKLVKMVGGKIDIYCIIDPVGIADNENQITALRAMEAEERRIERKLDSIVEMIELEGIEASSSYTIGNLKLELNLKLTQAKPDVVVMGKGKGLTNWILNYLINEYKKAVLILGSESNFLKGTEITVGYNPTTFDQHDFQLISAFSRASSIPLRLLNITNPLEKEAPIKAPSLPTDAGQNELCFCLENKSSSNIASALLDNVSKGQVELLCVGRSKCKESFFQYLFNNSTTFKIAKNIKIPLLIMSRKS